MKTTISLVDLLLIFENEKSKIEDRLKKYISFGYTMMIIFEFEVYKISNKSFSTKKPNFFIKLLKKVTAHKIKLSHQNIYIDGAIVDQKQANEIKIICLH